MIHIIKEKPNKSYKIFISKDGGHLHTGWKGYATGHGSDSYKERDNCVFTLELRYTKSGKGRSAVSFWFKDRMGRNYQMTMTAFENLYRMVIKGNIQHGDRGWFTATYTLRKQGDTYTLWILEGEG